MPNHDYAQIGRELEVEWLPADDGNHLKFLVYVMSGSKPKLIAGTFYEHKDIPLPKGAELVGAGDFNVRKNSGGEPKVDIFSWDSFGYHLYTPRELWEPIKTLLNSKAQEMWDHLRR